MKLLAKSVIAASVTRQSVSGCFRQPGLLDIVLAKETVIELLAISDEGELHAVCSQHVFGNIKDAQAFRCHYGGKDLLALLTDYGNISFLCFNETLHRFENIDNLHLSEGGFRPGELGQWLAVEPRGHALAVASLHGRIVIFQAATISSAQGSATAVDHKGTLYTGHDTMDEKSATWESNSSRGTIWSLVFSPNPRHSGVPGSVLHVVTSVHRMATSHSEFQLLQWDRDKCRIQCLLRVAFDHQGSLGILMKALPTPCCQNGIVVVGTKAVALCSFRCPDLCGNPTLEEDLSSGQHDSRSCYCDVIRYDHDTADAKMGTTGALSEVRQHVILSEMLQFPSTELATSLSWQETKCSGADGESTAPRISSLLVAMSSGVVHNLVVHFPLHSNECVAVSGYDDVNPQHLTAQWHTDQYQGQSSLLQVLALPSGRALLLTETGDIKLIGKATTLCSEDGHAGSEKLQLLAAVQSMGPTRDFVSGDLCKEGHPQLFSICSDNLGGSLRVIRTSRRTEELFRTSSEYSGVSRMWSVLLKSSDTSHAVVVLTSDGATRALQLGIYMPDVTGKLGLQSNTSTVHAGRIWDGLLGQVTKNSVCVCSMNLCEEIHNSPDDRPHAEPEDIWVAPFGEYVTTAIFLEGYVILGMAASKDVLLLGLCQVEGDSCDNPVYTLVKHTDPRATPKCKPVSRYRKKRERFQLQKLCDIHLGHEISCMAITGMDGSHEEQQGTEKLLVCGTYGYTIEMIIIGTGLPTHNERAVLTHVRSFPIGVGRSFSACERLGMASAVVPESCVAVRSGKRNTMYILIGLRNGMVVHYQASTGQDSTDSRELRLLSCRRLGLSPVSLVKLETRATLSLVAISDCTWLLWSPLHSGRLEEAQLGIPDIVHAAPLAFMESEDDRRCGNSPPLLCCDGKGCLRVISIDRKSSTNCIQRMLHAVPWCITAHWRFRKLLVIVSIAEGMQTMYFLRCFTPDTLEQIADFKFLPGERATCIHLWEPTCMIGLQNKDIEKPRTMHECHLEPPASLPMRLKRTGMSHQGQLLGGVERVFDSGMEQSGQSADSQSTQTMPMGKKKGPYIVVGTSKQISESILSDPKARLDGYDARCQGRLVLLELETSEGTSNRPFWTFRLVCELKMPAGVSAISPHPSGNIVVAVGNRIAAYGLRDNSRLQRLASIICRFPVVSMSTCPYKGDIAATNGHDSVVTYTLRPYAEAALFGAQLRFEFQVLAADSTAKDIVECKTVAADPGEKQIIAASSTNGELWFLAPCLRANAPPVLRPVAHLPSCEVYRTLREGSALHYDDTFSGTFSLMAASFTGGVVIVKELRCLQYEILKATQLAIENHPLIAHLLGHGRRGSDQSVLSTIQDGLELPEAPPLHISVVDGDMLSELLDLPESYQLEVLSEITLSNIGNVPLDECSEIEDIRGHISPRYILLLVDEVLKAFQ